MTTQLIDEIDADKQSRYADKIAKLVEKAEATDSEEEATLLFAKAQELMTRYAIDEAMLAEARGETQQDTIVNDSIELRGMFHPFTLDVAWAIVRANGCKGIWHHHKNDRPTWSELKICGFGRDVQNVVMLNASVQLQCAQQLDRWWRSEDRSWMTKMEQFKARRQFIVSFAHGLSSKLHEARRAGERAAAKDEAARAGVTDEVAGTSVALVLKTRKEQVSDWYDNTIGKGARTVSRRYQHGGASADNAGFTAGRNANIGGTSVGGSKGAITR